MKVIREMIDLVADTDAPVLVCGESGVGKELIARTIHDCSPRRGGNFAKVNCAARPSELLEAELFGHERGAFHDTRTGKPGKFDLAAGGTIYLDEVGGMPAPLQVKLLRVLRDHEFVRVGGTGDIKVDVRIVASTTGDLKNAVARRLFREDLYYRLNVVSLLVPPLRERLEDIPDLAEHFCQKYARRYNRHSTHLSRELLDRFQAYSWPGNVRELENLVRCVVVLETEEFVKQGRWGLRAARPTVVRLPEPAPPAPAKPAPVARKTSTETRRPPPWIPRLGLKEIARQATREAETAAIKHVLDEVSWNRVQAARLLKISYKAILYKIETYHLSAPRPTRRPRAHIPRPRPQFPAAAAGGDAKPFPPRTP